MLNVAQRFAASCADSEALWEQRRRFYRQKHKIKPKMRKHSHSPFSVEKTSSTPRNVLQGLDKTPIMVRDLLHTLSRLAFSCTKVSKTLEARAISCTRTHKRWHVTWIFIPTGKDEWSCMSPHRSSHISLIILHVSTYVQAFTYVLLTSTSPATRSPVFSPHPRFCATPTPPVV